MSNSEGQTQAPAEPAQPKAVRYAKGNSCVQKGAVHAYAKVEGKNYERCAACGSTRTIRAPKAAVAGQAAPAQAPAADSGGVAPTVEMNPNPQHKDLSSGVDVRGDQALFLYGSHVRADGSLDKRAAAAVEGEGAGGETFFRLLDESGREVATHGWAKGGRVVQWG